MSAAQSSRCTREMSQYKGHKHHASPDDPQYEIKSDKTDQISNAQRLGADKADD